MMHDHTHKYEEQAVLQNKKGELTYDVDMCKCGSYKLTKKGEIKIKVTSPKDGEKDI